MEAKLKIVDLGKQGTGKLFRPDALESAQQIAQGTPWCLAQEDAPHFYKWRDFDTQPLYMLVCDEDKFLLDWHQIEFLDSSGRELSERQFASLRDGSELRDLFHDQERKLLAARDIDAIINYANIYLGRDWKEAEGFLLADGDLENIKAYANDVKHGRWFGAEDFVVANCSVADVVTYFDEAINSGKFSVAEEKIAIDPVQSIRYATLSGYRFMAFENKLKNGDYDAFGKVEDLFDNYTSALSARGVRAPATMDELGARSLRNTAKLAFDEVGGIDSFKDNKGSNKTKSMDI